MIDKTKFIGAPENFEPARVRQLLSRGIINNIANMERAIFCLEYVGQLQKEGLDFMFKGGSAVQMLLGDKWNRLSVDVDICTDVSEAELKGILDGIHRKFDGKAFAYSPRREMESGIPFYLYRIRTPPITEGERVILLDVLGTKPRYTTREIPLRTYFYNSSIQVVTPTIGALLGDKLSIIGPNTIGRPLNDSRNGIEYAKHFLDIHSLSESNPNHGECVKSYREALLIQSKVRGRRFALKECIEDAIFTCQVASLPQRVGEKLIRESSPSERERARSEFGILQRGLQRFRPFLVQRRIYSWDNLREYASRTALILKIIESDITDTQANGILKRDVPTREKIPGLIEHVKTISEELRWFIVPDEIANFPRLLRTWHDFFFFNEILENEKTL